MPLKWTGSRGRYYSEPFAEEEQDEVRYAVWSHGVDSVNGDLWSCDITVDCNETMIASDLATKEDAMQACEDHYLASPARTKLEVKVVELLAGQYDNLAQLENLGVDIEEAEEIMLNYNYERCPECESWVESWELLDDDGEPIEACVSCRPKTHDDTSD